MAKFSEQMEQWGGDFGKEYTDRNALSLQDLEQLNKKQFGITRSEMNANFIGGMDRDIRILEVGSNIGNQLMILQDMGFSQLYGIDVQSYAVELAKSRTKNINIIQGSAFDIPFKDGFFDLVFTAGVLIHIAPQDINRVLDEIYRCTRRYIWGMEYYSEAYTEIPYRQHAQLLWKADFPQLFLDRFKNLALVKKKLFKYTQSDNVDAMYVLKKNE